MIDKSEDHGHGEHIRTHIRNTMDDVSVVKDKLEKIMSICNKIHDRCKGKYDAVDRAHEIEVEARRCTAVLTDIIERMFYLRGEAHYMGNLEWVEEWHDEQDGQEENNG